MTSCVARVGLALFSAYFYGFATISNRFIIHVLKYSF